MSNGDAPPESSALREARAQLDWLADHDLDVHPRGPGGIDLIRDRPDVVAWLCRLRETPLSMWTWAELLAWGGLRRQRLREVLWHRGLPPEPPGLLSLERRLEADVLVLASHDSAAFHHRIPNTIVDTRLADILAFGANRTPASRPVLAAACEELVPRGFFALEAWCAGVFDGKDPEQVAILAPGHVATLGGWQLGVRLPGPWH